MQTDIDIAAIRNLRGWTQGDLAFELGVDQATVSRWEKFGAPRKGPAKKALEKLVSEPPTSQAVES